MGTYKKMNPTLKDAWVKALRSGDYQQTDGLLNIANHYCCLGVLCEVAIEHDKPVDKKTGVSESAEVGYGLKDSGKFDSTLPTPGLLNIFGFTPRVANVLATKNDEGDSFITIADWIEKNL